MQKYKDKILNIIIYIFITLVSLAILFAIYNYINLKVLKKPYTNILGYTIFEVASGSMSNTINVGDIVIVQLTDKFKEQDIITYISDGEYITHRVIKINDKDIITKGDANNNADSPIKSNMVLGKVVKIIKNVGIWGKVITTPKVYISIFITISLFYIYFSKRKCDINETKQ